MKPRSKRLLIILVGLTGVTVASALVLNAFESNVAFFFSPRRSAPARRRRTARSASAGW